MRTLRVALALSLAALGACAAPALDLYDRGYESFPLHAVLLRPPALDLRRGANSVRIHDGGGEGDDVRSALIDALGFQTQHDPERRFHLVSHSAELELFVELRGYQKRAQRQEVLVNGESRPSTLGSSKGTARLRVHAADGALLLEVSKRETALIERPWVRGPAGAWIEPEDPTAGNGGYALDLALADKLERALCRELFANCDAHHREGSEANLESCDGDPRCAEAAALVAQGKLRDAEARLTDALGRYGDPAMAVPPDERKRLAETLYDRGAVRAMSEPTSEAQGARRLLDAEGSARDLERALQLWPAAPNGERWRDALDLVNAEGR